jgi:hypothetical protein
VAEKTGSRGSGNESAGGGANRVGIADSIVAIGGKLQNYIRSVARAGADARRAWSIAPHFYAKVTDKSLRPYTLRERLTIKYAAATSVFTQSVSIGISPRVVIRRRGSEGLLANLLHVIEVLHRVHPRASVHVNWGLTGNETGFRYGEIGSDVWTGLFRPIGSRSRSEALRPNSAVDYAFWGTGKDYLTGMALRNHRNDYHRTVEKWIEVTNQNVLERTRRTYAEFMDGRFCLGVHRRVENADVALLQKDGKVPSLDSLLAHCEKLLRTSGGAGDRIFLATDDAGAAEAFKRTFGARLIVQENIRRTLPARREIHFADWGEVSLSDAEDVLVDTMLLSRCNLLVHASSSVSTMASILNPNLTLVRHYEAVKN